MSLSLPGGWFESGHGSICIFVKDFRDPLERKKKMILKPWASIKDIKDQLQVVFNVPTNAQKLFYQGRELKNTHNLQQCGIYQDNAVIEFVARRQHDVASLYTTEVLSPASSSCCSSSSSCSLYEKSATSQNRNNQGNRYCLSSSSSSSSNHSNSLRMGRETGSLNRPPKLFGSPQQQQDPPLSPLSSSQSNGNLLPEQMPIVNIMPYGTLVLPVSLMKVLHQALQGLALGLTPTLAMDGTGGTYFLRDPAHRNVGCFKPQDEEPFSPNNPRGLVGELGQSGLRRGILSGEACERELAAYLLDKNHFANVPATTLVEARHPAFKYSNSMNNVKLNFKMGSLQEFIRHDDVVSDLAPNLFHPHQVHKIVLLDMRLLNTDRNDANILVRKKKKSLGGNRNSTNSSNSSNSSINNSSNSRNRSNSRNSSNSHNSSNSSIIEYELIPIDHGYCLPHLMEIAWCDWCWFNWPQLKEPLNEQDQKYILSLNPQEEADFLSTRIPLRKACKRNMIIAGTLVQKGVKAGISLYEIAKIMCREDLDKPSTLEKMCLNVFYQIILQQQQYLPHTNGHGLLLPSSPKKMPKIFIDTSSFNFVANPKSPVGPASPPGFWASHHPFRGPHLSLHHHEEVEVEDEEEEEEEVENKDPKRKQNHLFHTNTKSSSSISIVEVGNTSIPWDTMATNALTDALGKSKSKEISKQVFEQEEEEDSPQKIQQKISALATIKSSSTIATNTNTNAGTTTGTTAAASTISCLPHQSCDSNSKSTSTSTSSKSSLEGIGCEKDEFELLNENLDENQQNEKAFFLLLFKYMDDQIQEILLTTQKNK